MDYISYEEFKKMDIRVGTIRGVEIIPETDKLLRCRIDFNEVDEEGKTKLRQIISGIRESYPDYEKLIGKQVLYIVNLEPKTIKGFESNGMLMAVDGPSNDETGSDGKPVFLIPEVEVTPGSRIH